MSRETLARILYTGDEAEPLLRILTDYLPEPLLSMVSGDNQLRK